ncbi:MAG: SulP family inorganic anion transporter, partial [Casimicrobiaceae bacterium]
IAHSVIVGFTAGAAILIINAQLGSVLGIDLPRGAGVLATLRGAVARIDQINWPAPAVALTTLGAALLWQPFNRRFPAMLVAVVAGSLAAAALSRIDPAWQVATVRALPGALPPLSRPDFTFDTLRALLLPSVAMTLLALAEAVSIARALARRRQEPFDGNQEFFGQGLANVAGAFFSSYPASGSFNRSGVNLVAGAVTPLSAIAAAFFLVAILAFVAPLARYLPLPAVGAILLLVAWGLIDRRDIGQLLGDRAERIPLMATFFATLTLPLEWAILAGIAVSLVVRRCVAPAA